MSKPAARVGDMHVCPMVTPGVPPVPHVGGPIVKPATPLVLIGGLPAAGMGSTCVCVGPPDVVILGSTGVLIGGVPAARMGDSTAHGGTIVVGMPTVLIGEISPSPVTALQSLTVVESLAPMPSQNAQQIVAMTEASQAGIPMVEECKPASNASDNITPDPAYNEPPAEQEPQIGEDELPDYRDSGDTDTPVAEEPEEEIAVIVAVEFLDGSDDDTVSGEATQYVNLPREEKWVDGTKVLNIDRLSHKPRIKVTFDRPGSHRFSVSLVPGGSNSVYTEDEKTRNRKFKYRETPRTGMTAEDGTFIITDIELAAAGNDTYTLTGEDDHSTCVESSGTIRTKRLFYLTKAKMTGLTGIAGDISSSIGEFENNYFDVIDNDDIDIPHQENIGNQAETVEFLLNLRNGINASDAKDTIPYNVTLGFTDHLAVKDEAQDLETGIAVEVGPGKDPVGFFVEDADGNEHPLWIDLVSGEDWFVSCQYLPDGGNAADLIDIPKDKCSFPPEFTGTSNITMVDVDVTDLPEGEGHITLTVNYVNRFRGGLSWGGINVVCVCTMAWWQPMSQASQCETITHEIGHKVGMVANGTGNLPDKVSTHYDDSKGHVGNHCYNGCSDGLDNYKDLPAGEVPICIMYGSNARNGSTFCANCIPAIVKVDISAGWPNP